MTGSENVIGGLGGVSGRGGGLVDAGGGAGGVATVGMDCL